MATQTFKIEITGKDAAECIQKFNALKKLEPMDGPVLQGLSKNGPVLLQDPNFGPIIRQQLEIQ